MSSAPRSRREADLVSYYTQEIAARAGRELPSKRVEVRAAYLDQLRRERRRTVLEVGCGAGRDGQALASMGLAYTGVDVTPASVAICRSLDLRGCVASVLRLPFREHAFEAAWTMSTLMHLTHAELESGLAEIVRVLTPGAPMALGIWGDERAHEGPWDDGTLYGPARFFSYRTDEHLLATLRRFGRMEQFLTWPSQSQATVHYQWVVVRTP